MAAKLVTIIGGSGFLGRHIARRFAKAGWRVRVAVRRPNEAIFVRAYGDVGQVEPVQINIRDEASITRALIGADVVINTVGILSPDAKQDFQQTHHHAAGRIARIAKTQGIRQCVHVSALGASDGAPSRYLQSKFDGEEAVIAEFPGALIVRPSLMFGGEHDFFNRFGRMAQKMPFLGVIHGDTKFQPVFVDDVAQFIFDSVAIGRHGHFDLGGEEIMTMRQILAYVAAETRRRRALVGVPVIAARVLAGALDLVEFLSLGIIRNQIITRDQLKSLTVDNVVMAEDGLAAAQINPKRPQNVMRRYLASFRPRGEFEELIKPKL